MISLNNDIADLSKAFVTVDLQILPKKLKHHVTLLTRGFFGLCSDMWVQNALRQNLQK